MKSDQDGGSAQSYAQWKFRRQNRRFQREQILKVSSMREERAEAEHQKMCEFKLFLRPKQIEILKSLGVSYLASRVESELKTLSISRQEVLFETHGHVVSLKGFRSEFRRLFAELDRQGQLFESEVIVLNSVNTWESTWWAPLLDIKSDRRKDGDSVSQDQFQTQEGEADKG